MRFIKKIISKKLYFLFMALSFLLLTGVAVAQKDKGGDGNTIKVKLKVTDEAGSPLSGTEVIVGEGIIYLSTGNDGMVSFTANNKDYIAVTLAGYNKVVTLVSELTSDNTVRLKREGIKMTEADKVQLPYYGARYKRFMTGSSGSVSGEQLESYSSADIRNSLAGRISGLDITEINGDLSIGGNKTSATLRGKNPLFVVDGIPIDFYQLSLDAEEIESVTVIKDIVEASRFGPIASDGIVNIKTKRGNPNEKKVRVNVESGLKIADSFPEYVSGQQYATLNNKARTESSVPLLYTGKYAPEQYAKVDPYNKYHPNSNYREMILGNTMSYSKASVSVSGGNNTIQYNNYIGYTGEGDIFKTGSFKGGKRLNVHSNLDIKFNDKMKVRFDFTGNVATRNMPNGYPVSSVLSEAGSIPPIAFPVYANIDELWGVKWYGASSLYQSNPVGNATELGYSNMLVRNGGIKFNLDYDLSGIIKGLKSTTYAAFNGYYMTQIGKTTTYYKYMVQPGVTASGADTIRLTRLQDGNVKADESIQATDYNKTYVAHETLTYEGSFGASDIHTFLKMSMSQATRNSEGSDWGGSSPNKQQNLIWSGSYVYNKKFIIQGALDYCGNVNLPKANRFQLFHSVGTGFIAVDKSIFSGLLNYLKFRAEYGKVGYQNFYRSNNSLAIYQSWFWYDYNIGNWGVNANGTSWMGPASNEWALKTNVSVLGNPAFSNETREDFSVGFDALLLNNKLSVEATYFNNLQGDIPANSNTLPALVGAGNVKPLINYNKIRIYGVELDADYSDKIGGLYYSVGVNATVQNGKIEKWNEVNLAYNNAKVEGKPYDYILGQTYLGKFASDAEAGASIQTFSKGMKNGDLKYGDVFVDGKIDANDVSLIGNSSPRLYYGLNLKFNYKTFELFILGNGRAFYDVNLLSSPYFANGWGDGNYSKFVNDNIGGAYPRLTYYQIANNFQTSKYWLRDGSYFKLQNVELSYELPSVVRNMFNSRSIRVFGRGSNLLTISKIKDVDPESINSGVTSYPLFRTMSGGLKIIF